MLPLIGSTLLIGNKQMRLTKILMLAGLAIAPALVALPALAQQAAPAQQPVPTQRAAPFADPALKPNPANIPFVLEADIPWTGTVGKLQQYKILGDANKPGPYIVLMKWWPGAYSRPHFHEKLRYITVISGTWWVSSSTHYDPNKTYPLPAGTLVRDEPNTVHWDGAKDGPVVLQISGEGPAPNIGVDEDGNRLPPRAPNAAAASGEPK
jgi:quercetin dioxygenase-like cupin family protein